MKRLGQTAGLGALLALLPAADCTFDRTYEDCYDGLVEGEIVELEIVEPYLRDGPYTWVEGHDPGLPSCEAYDGLAPGGRHTFRVGARAGVGVGCMIYPITPTGDLGSVDFSSGSRAVGGVVSAQVPHCGGFYRLFALRDDSLDRDPFGEEATHGQLPPLRIQRYVSGDCASCFDEWVGEIRHVEAIDGGR